MLPKLKMQKLSTNKLFFGKWPYKIECSVQGSNLIRLRGIEWVKKFCTDDQFYKPPKVSFRTHFETIKKDRLLKFVDAVEPFLDKEIKIRAEGSTFNFYTSDAALVTELEQALGWCITFIYSPENPEEAEFLVNNRNKVICEAIPYGKYTHKVCFKEKIPRDKRLQFWSWISKYDEDTVKIGRSTEGFMIGTKQYVANPFCYVSNAKFLTMMSLVVGEYIQKIEEFVPRSTLLL